ncbi:hypothetical protein [Rubripirellula reticaptiva]|uniref:Uncharacterized protein n=1 Tax=Rubripirellula reticaptiva TaxID=2528013 RepID=A0A5C6F4E1_9BACT|nr:hypothetical protein [Rubripirellula reticaptiva]TWU55390.1 hypothetical protein Poly59_16880 [Rubripirellula reticaptiva]
MWTTNELGLAQLHCDGQSWDFDARGGDSGISFTGVALASVGDDRLPVAAEQFVRGDQWHINYPQGDGSFALRLVFNPIHSSANRLVIEVCTSIQTDLLDTHPKIDVEATCDDIDSFVPMDEWGHNEVAGAGCAPISLAKSKHNSVSVLLGSHDSPFTTNHSTDAMLRLRLFGDFLEKGVIRRARPWIVIDRSGTLPTEAELTTCWSELVASPIPLT